MSVWTSSRSRRSDTSTPTHLRGGAPSASHCVTPCTVRPTADSIRSDAAPLVEHQIPKGLLCQAKPRLRVRAVDERVEGARRGELRASVRRRQLGRGRSLGGQRRVKAGVAEESERVAVPPLGRQQDAVDGRVSRPAREEVQVVAEQHHHLAGERGHAHPRPVGAEQLQPSGAVLRDEGRHVPVRVRRRAGARLAWRDVGVLGR
mmetsp:Transcript_34472/g.102307  ORF Transcript_34472/g.102307 Transcript_34472/m.102307 type:complete len:204 (+) Transcript_34472:36-647(+)